MPITFLVKDIQGIPGTSNWVLYRPSYDNVGWESVPSRQPCPERCVVFFPGDISDFFGHFIDISRKTPNASTLKDSCSENNPEASEPTSKEASDDKTPANRTNSPESFSRSHFLDAYRTYPYSLEGLAWVLSQKYPRYDLIIIRPSLITSDGFSIYNHFIQPTMDEIGQPIGSPSSVIAGSSYDIVKATRQLIHILFNLYSFLEKENFSSEDNTKSKSLRSNAGCVSLKMMSTVPSIILAGFSKGGLVISQLIKEAEHVDIECVCSASLENVDLIPHTPADGSILGFFQSKHNCQYPVHQLWRNVTSVVYIDAAINLPNTLFRFSQKQLSCLYKCACATRNSDDTNRLTDKIKSLCSSYLKFFFHYTPRQLRAPSRYFLRGELYDVRKELESAGFQFIFFREYYAAASNEICTNNMHFSLLHDFDTRFDWNSDGADTSEFAVSICSVSTANKSVLDMHPLSGASTYDVSDFDALTEADDCISQEAEYNNEIVFFFDQWQRQTRKIPMC